MIDPCCTPLLLPNPLLYIYHGQKATKAIRTVMGDHCQQDDTNIFLAAWSTRMCQYVDDTGDVMFFRNTDGLGTID